MTLTPSSFSAAVTIFAVAVVITFTLSPEVVSSLGSGSTIAITYGSATICGIIAGEPFQSIQCYRQGETISVLPNISSFQSISGGQSFFCGLRSGGYSILCWDTAYNTNTSFQVKRIYYSQTVRLTDLTVGDAQVCALEINTGVPRCWRGGENRGGLSIQSPDVGWKFGTITSGKGFTCGILKNNSRVLCWGSNEFGGEIERQFSNLSMSSLVAGESHACGLTETSGILICKGKNDSGQLNFPSNSANYQFSDLALGANHSCAIQRKNGFVMCWGGGGGGGGTGGMDVIKNVSFESVVAGLDFTCGLTTRNLSVICWGLGWSKDLTNSRSVLPLSMVIPGPCVETSSCGNCGEFPDSQTLCHGNGNICKSCDIELPIAIPLPWPIPGSSPSPWQQQQQQQPPSTTSIARNKRFLAFVIVGSVGAFAGFCTIFYCLLSNGVCCFWYMKTHDDAVQGNVDEDDGLAAQDCSDHAMPSRSSSIKRQTSYGSLRRQRSGTSTMSSKHGEKAESFSLLKLAIATNNFSPENRIGGGSFGTVYKGRFADDGREVAVKRGETSSKTKKFFQDKESAFDSELALLSRVHHKNLVELVGFCEEKDERLLVYEYVSNGSLYDQLHSTNNTEKSSSILNSSWKMRIRVALDASRGIEYLHNYAVPPIIHRDIKSSNILLDANWIAKVSDFGLSLMSPESDLEFMSTKVVGTVGYIDPEYYVLNVLTAKSDVYGLGVVLLELLTGKRAVFNNEQDRTGPMGIVEYAVDQISVGELWKVLDMRVGLPEMQQEAEAIELVAYTAMNCVNLEGKDRPDMTDIVANLERALALCEEGSRGSISTATLSSSL